MLSVSNLSVSLGAGRTCLTGPVSFSVSHGEVFGIVGESGSGKSLTALAIPRLLPPNLSVAGSVRLDGQELLSLPEAAMRRVRGRSVATIFQDPASALNPVFTIGQQLEAALAAGTPKSGRRTRRGRALDLMARVGIPDPAYRHGNYPHQLSGGLCQRAMIALALAGGAKLLIADEPTTALDLTIQAQITQLLLTLVREEGLTIILISHDLGLVAHACDRVAVFYAGEVAELGMTEDIVRAPWHPYTRALLAATPDLSAVGRVLRGIPGQAPAAEHFPAGCRFRDRCPEAAAACEWPQALRRPAALHEVRCRLADPVLAAA